MSLPKVCLWLECFEGLWEYYPCHLELMVRRAGQIYVLLVLVSIRLGHHES